MMPTNQELEDMGLSRYEMVYFWTDKSIQDTLDKTDAVNRQLIKDAYNQAMVDLQTIIDQLNPTNAQVIWAVKKMAAIDKNILLYLKSEITE